MSNRFQDTIFLIDGLISLLNFWFMKTLLLLLSVLNGVIIFAFGTGLFVVTTPFGGNPPFAGTVIIFLSLASLFISIVLPWILFGKTRNRDDKLAGKAKWISIILALLPFAFCVYWIVLMILGVLPVLPPE